jgi:hypothetical protein
MGKHSTKGQIVLKRDRKLEVVYRAMPPQSSIEEHMAKFKELYPEDWHSLVYRYKEHERQTPEGKPHPMPEPTQYLLNIVKNYYRKTNKVVARSKREATPKAVTEHPQPEVVTEHPQPEAVTEHPQPEAVTEHPQPEATPEAMTEHPQPTA